MAKIQTAFRLSALDREALDHCMEHRGLPSRSAALRYQLREYARKEWGWSFHVKQTVDNSSDPT